MIRALIVEHEAPTRLSLKRLLCGLPDIDVVGEAGSSEVAFQLAVHLAPDLVLLDVCLSGEDGLQLARRLATLKMSPAVVFTASGDERARDAFDLDAVDYLVKPIRRERLMRALQRVAGRITERHVPRRGINVQQRGGVRLIPLDDLYYFQAEAKYVTVYHRNGESLLESSLADLEMNYGEMLLRIHRNALVVRTRLTGMERDRAGRFRAVLEGTSARPEISRRLAKAIRRWLEATPV